MHPQASGTPDTRPLVLIPAYKPEPALLTLVTELSASAAIAAIVVVDDGSGPAYCDLFRSVAALPNVHLMTHAVNLGKGAALKTGLNFAAVSFPRGAGVVTADADGQHATADVLSVARALTSTPGSLILGVRVFDQAVPFRSRFGNSVTKAIMRAVTGQRLADTQTGLRGIPLAFIRDLLPLRSTGYDFELDMLVACHHAGRPMRQIPIATIYLEGNRSSHFNPLLDSMRVYFVFVRFAAVSLVTAGLDNAIFILGMHFWPNLALCQTASRLLAGTFQFFAGKRSVFHSRASVPVAMPKFFLLVAFSGTLSYALIQTLLRYIPGRVIQAKLTAETILFFVSFVVQRDFVFAPQSASPSVDKDRGEPAP